MTVFKKEHLLFLFWITLLSLLYSLNPTLAQAKVALLDDSTNSLSLGYQTEFLEDKTGQLTLTDVRAKDIKWLPANKKLLNFGITASAYWFRFTVDNISDHEQSWYLELAWPHLSKIEVSLPQNNGPYQTIKTGGHYPFSTRAVADKGFVFLMNQSPGSATYYIRAEATYPLIFEPLLRSSQSYHSKFHTAYPILWLYYGAMMIMILYNLILYFLIRERNIIYLVVFIVSFTLLKLADDGLAFQYLWPNSAWWANASYLVFLSLMLASMTLFIREFINFQKLAGKAADKTWIYSVIVPNLMAPLIYLAVGINMVTIYISLSLTMYSMVIVVGGGILCVLKGNFTRAVRYTWISFTPLALSALTVVLYNFSILSISFLTTWSLHIGSALFVALLSVGLADKLTMLRNELAVSNTNISLMLQSISEKAEGDPGQTIDKRREEEIGQVLQVHFQDFMNKFKLLINNVRNNANILNSSSTSLVDLSHKMSTETSQVSDKSDSVASASEQMSSSMIAIAGTMEQTALNVNLIASSTEEMTTTVQEITKNTESARQTTAEAVSQSNDVSKRVDALGRAAEKIGLITGSITEISKKTNLLALNATIEAARAGESGQGFAVVAGEIKELAKQTALATQQINQQIKENQNITAEAVTEIKKIVGIINKVDEIVASIASAIEEQTSSTSEISENISQISTGISETNQSVAQCSSVAGTVARDVTGLSDSSHHMTDNSHQLQDSAGDLSKMAQYLTSLMGKFQV